MDIEQFLSSKKKDIVKKCFNLVMDTFPPETAEFLKNEKDRFLNPVGFTFRTGIESIFDELTGNMDKDRLNSSMENIIKIRAVQDFSPSEAISFVFLLKRAMLEELNVPNADKMIRRKLQELEERIDSIALSAFDIYIKCREKIQEIKTKGIRVV